MRKLLLALGLLFLATPSWAQCISVGGVNNVPQPGVVCLSEPIEPTYGATAVGITPASTASDIACLGGSATAVVRVQRVILSGTASTGVTVPVTLLRRAAADTGGTVTTGNAILTPVALDTNNVAVTASAAAWTANPTVNDTSPAFIAAGNLALPKTDGTTYTSGAPTLLFDFSNRNYSQAPIIRGKAQNFCVNLNTISVSTGLVNVTFHWTELAF